MVRIAERELARPRARLDPLRLPSFFSFLATGSHGSANRRFEVWISQLQGVHPGGLHVRIEQGRGPNDDSRAIDSHCCHCSFLLAGEVAG